MNSKKSKVFTVRIPKFLHKRIWRYFRKNGRWVSNPCHGGSWKIGKYYYTPYHTIEYLR